MKFFHAPYIMDRNQGGNTELISPSYNSLYTKLFKSFQVFFFLFFLSS